MVIKFLRILLDIERCAKSYRLREIRSYISERAQAPAQADLLKHLLKQQLKQNLKHLLKQIVSRR
jgi:hypothetical protein